MKLRFFTLFWLIALCANIMAWAQSSDEVYTFVNKQGGEFATATSSRSDLLHIKLSGPVNQEDLKVISNQYSLKTLDLREARILAGKVGFASYADNELSNCLGYLPLVELTLPSSLTSLQAKALKSNGAMLKKLCMPATTPPTCGLATFSDYSFENCELQVPQTALEAYKAQEPWSNFKNIKVEENGQALGATYTFVADSIKLNSKQGAKLTFNKELPSNAVISVADKNVALLRGDSIFGSLVGSTTLFLTVGDEKDSLVVEVTPQSTKYIEPFVDWNMTKDEILAKIGNYPHKDCETPSAGYDAIDFDFGNMGQRYVRYSFWKETGKLESVIIAFISPVDYRNRNMDMHMSERYNLKMVKSDLSKIFERGDITVETFVTGNLAMASYKPTVKIAIRNRNQRIKLVSSRATMQAIDVFIDSNEPFALDRGDGLEIAYNNGDYGFDQRHSLPLVVGADTITIVGGNVKRLGLSKCGLQAIELPDNNEITFLHVGNNELSKLNLSKTLKLEHLVCADNQLRGLDLTANTELNYVAAYMNFMSSCKVTGLSKLANLYINQNQIKSIDLTGCNSLVQFWADDNGIKQVTMPQDYSKLRALFLRNCRLSVATLQAILDKLPNVTQETITPDNKVWMRRVKLERTPNIENIYLVPAQEKGWIFDVKGIDSGVNDIDAQNAVIPVAYFDIAGKPCNNMQQGINIVKMSDGTVRKVMMK